jgi:DNA polymerase-3 subunit beta
MKFSCQQEEFVRSLGIAQKAIGNASVLPVLENVLLSVEGKNVEISATDLEISISNSFPANVQNEGKITLPAKTILSWATLVSGGTIHVERRDGESILLEAEGSNTSIKGISSEEFPILPVVKKDDSVLVSQKEFKKAIGEVIFSASNVNSRPVLSGILFHSDGNHLIMVGTDSYRLSEKRLSLLQPPREDIYCVIPSKVLSELEKISLSDEGEIEIIFSKNQVLFLIQGIRVISRTIEGQFPNYEQIIPKTYRNTIYLNRREFIQTIKRVGIFARENNNNIKLFFSEKELKVTTDMTEIGVDESVLSIKNSGGENAVVLNSQFLLDILLVLSGDQIVLKVGEKLSPILVGSSDSEEKGFLHIIMPLKV